MNTKYIHNKADLVLTITIYICQSKRKIMESEESHTFQLTPGAHHKLIYGDIQRNLVYGIRVKTIHDEIAVMTEKRILKYNHPLIQALNKSDALAIISVLPLELELLE